MTEEWDLCVISRRFGVLESDVKVRPLYGTCREHSMEDKEDGEVDDAVENDFGPVTSGRVPGATPSPEPHGTSTPPPPRQEFPRTPSITRSYILSFTAPCSPSHNDLFVCGNAETHTPTYTHQILDVPLALAAWRRQAHPLRDRTVNIVSPRRETDSY